MEEDEPMTEREYDYFNRQVERKMKWASGKWFSVGWDQMVTVCSDRVKVGELEERFNKETKRLEWRKPAPTTGGCYGKAGL